MTTRDKKLYVLAMLAFALIALCLLVAILWLPVTREFLRHYLAL